MNLCVDPNKVWKHKRRVQVLASGVGVAVVGIAWPILAQPQPRKRAAPPPPVTIEAPDNVPAPIEAKPVEAAVPEPAQVPAGGNVAAPEAVGARSSSQQNAAPVSPRRAPGTTTVEQAQVLGGVLPEVLLVRPWVPSGMAVGKATGPEAARASLLLERLFGRQSVTEMAGQGEIGVSDVRFLLAERVEPWGFFDGREAVATRRSLARWLWHNDATLQKDIARPQVLPRTLRLWVADYLGSVGDERALEVCEQIIRDTKTPVNSDSGAGDNPLIFQTVECIARFHMAHGEKEKSALAWLRVPTLYARSGWWEQDANVEAARAYVAAGQEEKARELYAKAAASPYPWFVALAVGDQARALMGRGEHLQAQKMLRGALPIARGDRAEVLVRALLARSLLQTFDLAGAKSAAEEALSAYEALPEAQKPAEAMLERLARGARDEASGWLENPIRIEPRELKLAPSKAGAVSIPRRLTVRTLRAAKLKVSSSAPQVTARVLGMDGWSEGEASSEQVILVEVAPGAPPNAALSITSEQYPNVEAKVPVLSGTGS